MEQTYFDKIKKELLSPGFQQEVFIERKTLDKESARILLSTFWDKKAINEISEYVDKKRHELYKYSIEQGFIDKDTSFEKFSEL